MSREGGEKAGVLPAFPQIEVTQGVLRIRAPAKINLDLLVAARRADGYHDLDSLVAKVTLYDELELRPRDDGRITFSCAGADCGSDEKNLALRAARALEESMATQTTRSHGTHTRQGSMATQTTRSHGTHTRSHGTHAPGADIRLIKKIPPGRGLGGGSSDAAAVLLALNEMWDLRLDAGRLCDLAVRLGSDVPLFLGPAASRMTGRGEQIAPVAIRPFRAVLYLPEFACPTGDVYRAFDELPAASGETGSAADPAPSVPLGRRLDLRLISERPPSQWRGLLRNDLVPAAEQVQPELREVRERLAREVRLPVGMTGSGSALFVLCDDDEETATVFARASADLRGHCVVVQSNPW